MKNRVIGSALIAALLSSVSGQPAQAQFNARDAFGITTDIFRLGVEINRANAEQERANAVVRQQQQQAAQAEANFYRRVQTALKTLGYYTMSIDGDPGPGTNRAIAEYQAAFDLSGVMDDMALDALERHAAQGWRSKDEVAEASAAGFADRQSYVAAKGAGFADARQFQAAQSAGFADAESFAAFERSGAADKAGYEAQLAAAEKAEELTGQCLAGGDWRTSLASCRLASEASPNDAALALALDKALADAQTGLEESERQLTAKKAEMAKLLAAKDGVDAEAVTPLRVEINSLVETNLLAGLHLKARDCSNLVDQQDWDAALPACYADTDVGTLSGAGRAEADALVAELAAGRQKAESEHAAEQARLAQEAERLALAEAKQAANALLAQVNAYAENGRTFEQGVAIARALVAIRASVGGKDAARINADHAALSELVEADAGFVAARAAMAEAQSQASQSALVVARRQAEIMDAFILAFIGTNVTSDKVADLLPVSEALSAALAAGNGEVILSAQAAAREQLAALDLMGQLEAFGAAYAAPQVSAEAVEAAEAEAANAQAEAANAEQALAMARADAGALLDAIDGFARSGGNFADPIAVARAIARLKASLAQPQLAELTSRADDLESLLDADPAFVAAMAALEASQGSAMANAIALAREELGEINQFLLAHIAANLTDDAIVDIVDLQVTVETTLAAADSAATVQTRDRVLASMTALKLDQDLLAHVAAQRASRVSAGAEVAQNGLSVTPANAALLEGGAGDLLVLRRADGLAPHLTYNLLGQLAVDGGIASACWAHATPDNPLALLMARQDLRTRGVPALELVDCTVDMDVDLVLLRRGDFIASPPSQALHVVSAFEEGQLDLLLTIEGAMADAEMARLNEESQRLAMAVDNGTASGFGLISLNGNSGAICPVVERIEAHRTPLVQRGDAIAFAFTAPRLGTPMPMEAAFAAAQRGQCAGIYADAATLKTFTSALARIGADYAMTSVWVDAAEVDAEMARLATIEAEQIERAAREAQQREAEAAILAAQTADQRTALEIKQAELRAQYQDRADAGQKDIADMVRAMVGSGNGGQLRAWFPATHDALARLANDRWVITDHTTGLADYGTASWQNRSVDAVLVEVNMQRENALAGVYGEDCFVLGWLVDTEFRVQRDPFEARCSDVTALETWQSGRAFESVWNLAVE